MSQEKCQILDFLESNFKVLVKISTVCWVLLFTLSCFRVCVY